MDRWFWAMPFTRVPFRTPSFESIGRGMRSGMTTDGFDRQGMRRGITPITKPSNLGESQGSLQGMRNGITPIKAIQAVASFQEIPRFIERKGNDPEQNNPRSK